ncbi:hypothetical protein ACFL08_00015 [Patescibacteria group bacterium]
MTSVRLRISELEELIEYFFQYTLKWAKENDLEHFLSDNESSVRISRVSSALKESDRSSISIRRKKLLALLADAVIDPSKDSVRSSLNRDVDFKTNTLVVLFSKNDGEVAIGEPVFVRSVDDDDDDASFVGMHGRRFGGYTNGSRSEFRPATRAEMGEFISKNLHFFQHDTNIELDFRN